MRESKKGLAGSQSPKMDQSTFQFRVGRSGLLAVLAPQHFLGKGWGPSLRSEYFYVVQSGITGVFGGTMWYEVV